MEVYLPVGGYQPLRSATGKRNDNEMEVIDRILQPGNLTKACKDVVRNKGAGGVDGMSVKYLKACLDEHCSELEELIRSGNYLPQPIRGKEISKGKREMRLLGIPIEINGKLIKRRKGVPQGSPISPFLSNVILHELDTEMEQLGFKFVRYADDFSIYCKSKQEARKTGNTIYLFLRDKLKLPINREKSGVRRPMNFQILGFGLVPTYQKGVKGQYQLVVTEKRWKSLKAKLKDVTRKTNPMSLKERLVKLEQIQRGWINHFKPASIQAKLLEVDGWVRNRLRYCIWHHWKKPGKKRRSLIRLGVKHGMAYAWSRTRMRGWAVAQSPILRTTITIKRLKNRGYISLSDLLRLGSPKTDHYTLSL